MPTYDYDCKDCKKTFSDNRKISERDEPIECIHCKSMNTERDPVPKTVHHIYKGPGWFKDGYASLKPMFDKEAIKRNNKKKD